MGKLNFEKLYNQWIINSVNKTFAEEVLVYNIDNSIVGFVTLGIKTSIGQIGIMSVDSQYRGIGIGRALITAAERWFSIHNYSGIQVITQGDNTAACRLYERCGFSKGNVEYFYHVWKK
ncbi:MAG: GNAT family N-acetyltransferase [Saprospiraceae bacterium]|nr:GNAT family N-acetyltransferase [Saprospiraceae bacterium]